jgi:sugar lactone lactonase YvrE
LGKVAEEEEQMYPQIRMVRQILMLGLVVTLVVLAMSACGGGSGAKDRTEEAATMKTMVGDGGEQLGDGDPAKSAGLCGPNDVTLDASGNMYISDGGLYCSGPGGYTVRKVDPHGIITTVAGTGKAGYSGDGGPATKARLNVPIAVAVDRDGNFYLTDGDNYRIRKVDKEGIITTFAGTGHAGYSGDGGPATEADLTVADIALDGKGNIYFSDLENQRIRKIDREGIIHTVAGSGKRGYSGDGGPATEAALKDPWGIAVDGEGNLFFGDHHNSVIRKVDSDGMITTVAGTGKTGFNREKGPATEVMLHEPIGLFFDDDSDILYISDTFNARIRALRLEGT